MTAEDQGWVSDYGQYDHERCVFCGDCLDCGDCTCNEDPDGENWGWGES